MVRLFPEMVCIVSHTPSTPSGITYANLFAAVDGRTEFKPRHYRAVR
jgi:hypothetical protein